MGGAYLLRQPTPEPRRAALGLEVKPDLPGRLPSEIADQSHGPIPTNVLVLEPADARGFSRRALVGRAHSRTP
jgi:hypothetical protein